MSLLAGSGTLRIVLPEERANRISISIDVQRPNSIGADIDILINLGGIRSKRLLRAMGSRIQTFVIEADLSALEDSEVVSLSLQLATEKPLQSPLEIIDYLLESDRSPEEPALGPWRRTKRSS